MFGKLKKIVLIIWCTVLLGHLAAGQSHFMYIQSEEGTPFYIRMNDSLLSSTHSGYLILHQLQQGTYPVVIGLAKKKVPEAAFKIRVTGSDKGYMLRTMGGKLQLVNIQSNKVIPPVEVATSAGNRILPSTIADIAEQSETEPTAQPLAGNTETPLPSEQPDDSPSDSQGLSFEKMLSTVTGSPTPSVPVVEKAPKEKETDTQIVNKTPVIAGAPIPEKQSMPIEQKVMPLEDKDETPSFFDLLKPGDNEVKTQEIPSTAAMEPALPQPTSTPAPTTSDPAVPSQDLAFIDFTTAKKDKQQHVQTDENLYNDTIITSGKELRQWKKRQNQKGEQPDKGSFFDELLAKVDTATSDTAMSQSVANPLFGNDNRQEGTINKVCNEIADQHYFRKVRRKIAGKKSQQAMLRTANRYLSEDKCFTVSQIKQLAYLFASDVYRLQFLKTAYMHCSEKNKYDTLIKTLSGKQYQNRLKAFIR